MREGHLPRRRDSALARGRRRCDSRASAPPHPERAADTKLSLVAYSTPREAYGKLIPLFQKTPAGKDVELHAVLRRVR